MTAIMVLEQEEAERISYSFLNAFYSGLTNEENGDAVERAQKQLLFYAANAEFSLKSQGSKELSKYGGDDIAQALKHLNLTDGFFDLSKGKIEVIPTFFKGIIISVSGTFKRANEENHEVKASYKQAFMLLPEVVGGSSVYYILKETFQLGKEEVIKPQPKSKPVEKKAPPQAAEPPKPPAEAPEKKAPSKEPKTFSYANALSTPKTETVVEPAPAAPPARKPVAPPVEPASDQNSIVVKKVPDGATDKMLTNIFNAYGTVKNCEVPAGKQIAFIEFTSSEPVTALLSKPSNERKVSGEINGEMVELEIWKKEKRGEFSGRGRVRGRGRGAHK